ncbi:MAG: Adenine deaminase [Firmicutes bacterium]|nr:Adenine deaminase [Bacillota bacterium]
MYLEGLNIKPLQQLVDAAIGRRKADLILKNATIFNVFTGEFFKGDVAVAGGYIAGVGRYEGVREIDVSGKYVTPGFFDAHVHIESAMVSPFQFARAVVANGTTSVAADPHEIANVLGIEGIRYMLTATERLPLNTYVMLPSCVPSTELEHSGAKLSAQELEQFLCHPRVLGLGEVMDYPGVLTCKREVLEKLQLVSGRRIDGHAPGLSGKELTAYIVAGVNSDHECVTPEEATERLAQGMHIMLREGSAVKNLRQLLPAVTARTMPLCMLATDDRHPEDLQNEGHINHLVRLAIEAGTDLSWTLTMATKNAADYFGIPDVGAIAPGYKADILVFDNLKDWCPIMVFKDGQLVAENGQVLFEEVQQVSQTVKNSMHLGEITAEKLRISAMSSTARVIDLVPRQLVTRLVETQVARVGEEFVAEPERDILKLAVWERHHATGHVGVGLLRGLGLSRGAIASTVAHDAHNVIVVGACDEDMILAVRELERIGGGIAITGQNKVLGSLALPLAGLMSQQDIGWVSLELAKLHDLARQLGVKEEYDPFMTLAFLSLPVIPEAKLTDAGLVDVIRFQLVPVSV